MRSLLTLLAAVLMLAGTLHADTPATKPASRPAAPLDEKNSVEATLPDKPAAWRVFKGWKEQQLTGGVARSWVVPPIPQDAGTPISTYTVAVLGGGKPDVTIEGFADLNKQALQQRDPQTEFVRDESIDFAGSKGWLLVYDTTQTGTVKDQRGNERRVKSPVRSHRILTLHGEFSATLTFTCAPDDFDRLMRNIDRVNTSFAWR